MTGTRLLLACVLVVVSLAGCDSGASSDSGVSGSAACAAPATEVSATTAHPGDTLTVVSHDQLDVSGDDECPDTGRSPVTWTPRNGLEVTWQQENRTATLATGDADANGELTTVVTVPADALPGPATIVVDHAEPATIEVVR